MGMYPPCAIKDECKSELGYLWREYLCNKFCMRYTPMEMNFDFSEKPEGKPGRVDNLAKEMYNLRKELAVQNNLLNEHLDWHRKQAKQRRKGGGPMNKNDGQGVVI